MIGLMDTVSLRVWYRPVRFGWCVRTNNLADLREVLRLTHTLWGGRYNPIIPVGVDGDLPDELIELFRVDTLFPAADDPNLQAFIGRYPHLPWPDFHKELYIDGLRGGKVATFLDIYHPVRHLFEEFIKDKAKPQISAKVFQWDLKDPLQDVFLAMFGSYPAKEHIGKDYEDFVVRNLRAERVMMNVANAVPVMDDILTPSAICAHRLEWHRAPRRNEPGIYVVRFWILLGYRELLELACSRR